MRIVIDARMLGLTTGRYVERLLHHLQELDTTTDYQVLLLAKDMDHWQPTAPNFHKVEANFPIYSAAEQTGLARLCGRLQADLVHFTMANHPVPYRRAHLVTVHDLTLIDFVNRRDEQGLRHLVKNVVKPAVFKGVMWWAATQSEAVITPTKYVREQLIRRFGAPSGRVFVTYEAADPLAAEPEPVDIGQGDEYLLFVGNAYPYKNLWTLIQAFHQLRRPGLKLVLVGKPDYYHQDLERRVQAASIEGVVFPGFVPDAQLVTLYEHANLYVLPSLSEGFGLPALEAMQYGVPVLASRASCLPEVCGDGAEYFDPESVDDLTAQLRALLEDRKRRARLGQAGRERARQFSWRRMAEQTLEIYRRLGHTGR